MGVPHNNSDLFRGSRLLTWYGYLDSVVFVYHICECSVLSVIGLV